MSVNNNIWEVAEAYLAGALSDAEVTELKARLETDAAFAAEFNDATNLISSFEGSGRQKRFRGMLRDIHQKQASVGNKPRRIQLLPQAWRTAAIAASVALFTSALTFWSVNPAIRKNDSQYNTISREVEHLKRVQAQQQAKQDQLIQNINKNNKPAPPPSSVKYTGTGFALTNDGYFVTAYHVINDGKGDYDSVYIQTHDGQYYKANLVNYNAENDVAVLKVEKKNFHFGKGEVPYTFTSGKSGLGSEIFTLGYPKDDIVYSEGYISSKNGFQGDNMQYTLVLPAGHGQSGSPVIDSKGNILGLLTAVGGQEEANTYAVSSKAVIELLHSKMPDDRSFHLPRSNKMGRMGREQLVEKMEAYTVSVKVYKR